MAEQVSIDGIILPRDGYADVENLDELWQPATTRGANDIVPGAPGSNPNQRRKTQTARSLRVVLYGIKSYDGVPHVSARVGLEANRDHFVANVVDPPGTADGTRTAVLTLPSGATKSGLIHVEDFPFRGAGPVAIRGVLNITLVDGELS